MNIDIRTIILVTGITNILQIIVLFHQYLMNKVYRGLGWWVLAFLSVTVGFVLLSLRNTVSVELVTIVMANFLILLNPVFLYIGIARFLGCREEPERSCCSSDSFYSTLPVLYLCPSGHYESNHHCIRGKLHCFFRYRLHSYLPQNFLFPANHLF